MPQLPRSVLLVGDETVAIEGIDLVTGAVEEGDLLRDLY
jgi:hypothetical protein